MFFRKYLLSMIVSILIFSMHSCTKEHENINSNPFNIIPHPKNIELIGGKGLFYGDLSKVHLEGEFRRPVMGNILSMLTESDKSETGTLTLKLANQEDLPESKEGYILTVSKGEVEIISRGEAGLFYGCQTLEQILEDSRDHNTSIPACKIIDYPSLEYRAIQIDVKHHLDHMRVYYEMIDKLASYKINAIIFEFEDKIRYKRQPLIGAPQAISIDEMSALTKYARDRHIEISPLVQGLGHATFILKHELYAHLRELSYNRWAFCPMDEGTYDVLFDMYLDAMEATPGSRYLHIGGDEIGNIGICPRCKPTADKEGVLHLNLYWLNRVCDFIAANGRIPIFWDDMPLKEAGVFNTTRENKMALDEIDELWKDGEKKLTEAISNFPKECIYMRWNYTTARQPGNIRAIDWYKNNGLEVWISTAAQSGPAVLFPFDDRDKGINSRGLPAIQSFIQLAAEKEINGMLCTAWDDRSLHYETYWRGHIASAEFSWNPEQRNLKEFDKAWLQREFGTSIPDFVTLYKKLREASVFYEKAFHKEGSRLDYENAMVEIYPLWPIELPPDKPGTNEQIDYSYKLIELPDRNNPGKWSKKYAERLELAEKINKEYQITSMLLRSLYSNSFRNRYHWEIFMALNNLQITAPKLLIALKKCDTSDEEALLKGKESVSITLKEFDLAWQKLESVYSKTRFISYPDNYVPDRYFQFASHSEDLTYLKQTEELFHKIIVDWINLE
jgi:hexosaminidase